MCLYVEYRFKCGCYISTSRDHTHYHYPLTKFLAQPCELHPRHPDFQSAKPLTANDLLKLQEEWTECPNGVSWSATWPQQCPDPDCGNDEDIHFDPGFANDQLGRDIFFNQTFWVESRKALTPMNNGTHDWRAVNYASPDTDNDMTDVTGHDQGRVIISPNDEPKTLCSDLTVNLALTGWECEFQKLCRETKNDWAIQVSDKSPIHSPCVLDAMGQDITSNLEDFDCEMSSMNSLEEDEHLPKDELVMHVMSRLQDVDITDAYGSETSPLNSFAGSDDLPVGAEWCSLFLAKNKSHIEIKSKPMLVHVDEVMSEPRSEYTVDFLPEVEDAELMQIDARDVFEMDSDSRGTWSVVDA